MRTRRWTRSPRGQIFGVATGLAEWRGLPPDLTRTIVFLIVLFTGAFPGLVVYLVLAAVLPPQSRADIIEDDEEYSRSSSFSSHRKGAVDAEFRETGSRSSSSSRERDWDKRFHDE